MSDIEGGCACGAVRFKVTQPFFMVGACHCRDCQYSTGGGPAYVGLAPKGSFELTRGTPKRHVSKGDSGGDVARCFCGDCGTPLYSDADVGPFVPVKVGALDDPAGLAPGIHIYTASAQPWHLMTEGAPQFPKAPPGPG